LPDEGKKSRANRPQMPREPLRKNKGRNSGKQNSTGGIAHLGQGWTDASPHRETATGQQITAMELGPEESTKGHLPKTTGRFVRFSKLSIKVPKSSPTQGTRGAQKREGDYQSVGSSTFTT